MGVNTHSTNKIIYHALRNNLIKELQDAIEIKPEIKFGKNTRFDFLLINKDSKAFVEVKNVTLSRTKKIAEFPDAITSRGLKHIKEYENYLLDYATKKLLEIDDLKIYGESKNKTSVVSFNIGKIHPYDIGSILDNLGIAVRTGQHCAQPIMDYFKISGTIRISFYFYNTTDEIDKLVDGLNRAIKMLS